MVEPGRTRALILGLLAVIIWGGSYTATKTALRELHPLTLIWLRYGMGMMVIGAAVLLRGKQQLPSIRDLGYYAQLGFIGITIHQWLQSTGLQTADASTTAWIVATAPVFIAILGYAFLREPMTPARLLGIALAAAGVLMMTTRGDLSLIGEFSPAGTGNLFALGSAITWAIFSVLSRHGLRRHPPVLMLFFVMTFGWLFSAPLLLASGIPALPPMSAGTWGAAAFLGVFCSGIAYLFWYSALYRIPASQVGALLYVEPPVAALLAAVLIQESLTPVSITAGAVILMGVWLVTRQYPQASTKNSDAVP